jgi:alpha-1,2-mannosyltransferase
VISADAGAQPESLDQPDGSLLRRSRTVTAVIVVTTLVGLGLRLYQLARPGFLFGATEYDDGVDFGSAVRFVHGSIPYRDFIMVQPPGITVLMAPVALATKAFGTSSGMAVARLLTALAGAASVPLGGLLVRHRGLCATVVTCGVLAVYPDALQAARTVLLEPWLVLFCLLGALAAFDGDRFADRQRLMWGGLAFGFAGAVKVWAILPVLVITALAARRPWRAATFAASVTVGFLVVVLPFALLAPVTFFRSVIFAQLVRSGAVRVPLGKRLEHMFGLSYLRLPTPILVLAGIGVILILTGLSLLGTRLLREPPPVLDRFATISCVLVIVAFLWPPDFYYHYTAFLAPFLAMAVALPFSRVLAGLPASIMETKAAVLLRRFAMAGVVLIITGLVASETAAERHLAPEIPGTATSAAMRTIPPGACVVTDEASFTIAINRFVSDVPSCPKIVDAYGSYLELTDGHEILINDGTMPALPTNDSSTRASQRLWLSAFQSAQYVWLASYPSVMIPWTPQLREYFLANFVRIAREAGWLYARKGSISNVAAISRH